ncbi:MAG: hypothetical protein A2Y03_08945 [Omnitrophica WOR_2 bacterium GWF2_38_59]|nr:MAG: hypothetical protein A2Y03_08945 [Omnitrophica WOR_2 bacterium GWF2_38_59]OGX46746.1 MAG: hypothetical protein A2243_02575 [Omnitrophica WOR_2 bacterium RIFOXYA2_FULL_38_17]OGX53437.1 MAG: hypothetical protein A2267_09855 [Omnitrophica WOR_2 bacterium RIFOXYA12_FULL_38_10]OGX56616.1 MAG: hypothetical protein A2447_07250 [Omnitrophica WOR_2 bacterium RIFOXYC2_FULL_38_12]OGX59836.1 MAG: hypothetical protein A2306_06100 [Omnitrophica WOR_2 bacterium RIFOXYB2_FULL_38_16]
MTIKIGIRTGISFLYNNKQFVLDPIIKRKLFSKGGMRQMKVLQTALLVCLLFIFGCEKHAQLKERSASKIEAKQDEQAVDVKNNSFKPFYIYSNKGSRENHYVPSGFMPNGKCLAFSDDYTENCYSERTCMRIVYGVQCSREDQNWAGIYWLNPPNNWGQRKGGYNLTGAQKLSFWAKGENGGEQIQEITIGGITGNYPDSDIAVIGPIILTKEWKEYTVDLRGKDLSYISGGFSWTTSADVNSQSCIFYLDEIKFE